MEIVRQNEKFINNPLYKLLPIINGISQYITSPPDEKQTFEEYFLSTNTPKEKKPVSKEENHSEKKEKKVKEEKERKEEEKENVHKEDNKKLITNYEYKNKIIEEEDINIIYSEDKNNINDIYNNYLNTNQNYKLKQEQKLEEINKTEKEEKKRRRKKRRKKYN